MYFLILWASKIEVLGYLHVDEKNGKDSSQTKDRARTFPRNPAEVDVVGKFLYQDTMRLPASGVIQLKRAKREGAHSRRPHLKLQIAILPWPWFRFCKVMLWRKVSGIYQESWYNSATTIDAMKRLAPPHLPLMPLLFYLLLLVSLPSPLFRSKTV